LEAGENKLSVFYDSEKIGIELDLKQRLVEVLIKHLYVSFQNKLAVSTKSHKNPPKRLLDRTRLDKIPKMQIYEDISTELSKSFNCKISADRVRNIIHGYDKRQINVN
jgi:hypothetical protein